MPKSKGILDDSDDEAIGELNINKAYADRYDKWRLGEELQKLKDRYGEDATLSSDSETSDEDYVEPDNPEFDHDFLLTLGALHKKELKDDDKFFPGDYRLTKNKDKEKKEEVMTLNDYQRHIIIDRKGQVDEEEEDDEESDKGNANDTPLGTRFKFDDGGISSDDDGDDLFKSGLFKQKEKTSNGDAGKSDKVVEDAVAFVKGESSSIGNQKNKKLLEGLKNAWSDPKLPREDKWLADFFLNKRYLEEDDESIEREYNEVVIDEETLSEDEKTLETMDTFETKYRFRYEEPDQDFIKRHPRIIEDSVRVKDDRRKQHREALKERKAQEKEMKRQEIQKLKALKYKEIEEKIEKIKEASGNDEVDFGDNGLEEDFDPSSHDAAMSRMFGEDYYADDDGNTEKPVFSDDEDIIKDYDDWLEKGGNKKGDDEVGTSWEGKDEDAELETWEDTENFNMDADYDEETHSKEQLQREMIEASRKKGRKKTKFARALSRKKPVFDPKEKDFDSYFEEYYQMNFEDVVGGIPCRFKYRNVEGNYFGLSTEEILSAQDKELNRWFSLKKMLRYDRDDSTEQIDRRNYDHRASLERVKQKILPSLFVEDPEEVQLIEQEKKRVKNLKKKLRRQQREAEGVIENHPLIKQQENDELLPDQERNNNDKKRLLDVGEESASLKSKKRKSKKSEDLTDSSAVEGVTVTDKGDSPKKKKKKKSAQPEDEGTEIAEPMTDVQEQHDATVSKSKKKKKHSASVNDSVSSTDNIALTTSQTPGDNSELQKSKKKRNRTQNPDAAAPTNKRSKEKRKKNKKQSILFRGISDARLAAYGENPKKMKNKVIYGKKEF